MFSISRAAVVTLLCISVPAIAVADVGPVARSAREVLPDTVIPTHYDLLLSPDPEALTYRGKVSISIDVRAATKEVDVAVEPQRPGLAPELGEAFAIAGDRQLRIGELAYDESVRVEQQIQPLLGSQQRHAAQ